MAKISQKFTVARPLAEVWAFFQDVPAVARCMPGAELTEDRGGGLFAGKVRVRLGPFGANFEGEAKVTADPAAQSGHVEGKGVDKRGGSRSRMVMDYRLVAADGGTEVAVDADVTLAGAIAQFGRTSLIQETANILVQDFVGALERELAPQAQSPPARSAAQGATSSPATAELPLSAPAARPIADGPQAPAPAETVVRPHAPEPAHAPDAEGVKPRHAPAPAAAELQQRKGQGPGRARGPQRAFEPAASPEPAPREIRGGSLALRALWAWLKSLLRDLFSGSDRTRH